MIPRPSSRTDPCLVFGSGLVLAVPLSAALVASSLVASSLATSSVARAQAAPQSAAPQSAAPQSAAPKAAAPQTAVPPAASPTAPNADILKQRDQELDTALARQRNSAEAQAKLRGEIEALSQDRRKFNQQLIETAGRVREVEARINASQGRLDTLNQQEGLLRKSLEQRQGVIVEIVAALQRVGRQPPPAILVSPEDALRAVRAAITLGAVVPDMRSQTDALAADIAALVNVRKEIVSQRDQLTNELDLLGRDQLRLTLLVDQRQKKQASIEQTLSGERQRAADLARQVDTIKDLIAKLESGLDRTTRASRAADRGIAKDATQPELAALSDPGRLAPAIAFADMRGRLRLPVNGARIREFGGPDGAGGTQKGLSIAARAGGEITAPCDGWVVYAGRFRSYGQLLILNAGGGYHVLLAGMERISVDLGQFVLTGEPVAVMGDGSQASPTGLSGPKQPVLYVEFRKDGTPIDPSPWWATNESEKVRG